MKTNFLYRCRHWPKSLRTNFSEKRVRFCSRAGGSGDYTWYGRCDCMSKLRLGILRYARIRDTSDNWTQWLAKVICICVANRLKGQGAIKNRRPLTQYAFKRGDWGSLSEEAAWISRPFLEVDKRGSWTCLIWNYVRANNLRIIYLGSKLLCEWWPKSLHPVHGIS